MVRKYLIEYRLCEPLFARCAPLRQLTRNRYTLQKEGTRPMDYRRLGEAGTRVSTISLGSWLTYGEGVEQRTAEACIATAVEHGINFIDTADAYAAGGAERFLGSVLPNFTRSDLVLSSKL